MKNKFFFLLFLIVYSFSLNAQDRYEVKPNIDVVHDPNRFSRYRTDNKKDATPPSSPQDRARRPDRNSNSSKQNNSSYEVHRGVKVDKKTERILKENIGVSIMLINEKNVVSIIYNDGYGFTHFTSEDGDLYSDGDIKKIKDHIEIYSDNQYARFATKEERDFYYKKYKNDIVVLGY